jgi:putative ABC transport system permease protein
MPFPFTMAWRETRAVWRHFLYFFLCIALGVGALVSIALFARNLEQSVTQEARGLMAADLEVRLSHRLSEAGQSLVRGLSTRGVAMIHVSELVAMAAGKGQTQIIELKAVEEGYPFYGKLRVEPDRPLADLLASPSQTLGTRQHDPSLGAIVQESLLLKMGLAIGDPLKIGEATFVITGIIKKEPDRVASLFSLGPRVLVSQEGLAVTDLIKPGSRVRERYLLRLSPGSSPEPLLYELRGRLTGESARVLSYREAQPQLRRSLEQLTRYLGLIGLIGLFVGGIGVASTVQAFIREKLTTIAILKTLGAASRTVMQTYLVQALVLGLIGSMAGAALGIVLQQALPKLLVDLLPLDQLNLSLNAAPIPILKGIAMGVLTTLLFSLWPLLGIRQVRPALIFRRDVPDGERRASIASVASIAWCVRRVSRALRHKVFREDAMTLDSIDAKDATFDRTRIFAAVTIVIGLAGLAVWQAGSLKVGLIFIGALLLAVVVLRFAAVGLVKLVTRIPLPRSVPIRHAIRNLYRPGSQALGILLSVGIGVMVMVSASLLEGSLIDSIGKSRPVAAPTFFFIDIQPDQQEAMLRVLQTRVPNGQPVLTPLVRSRLYTIDGHRVDHDRIEEGISEKEREKSWYFTREYVLTFLKDLPKDNAIVKGDWWTQTEGSQARPQVSIEEDAAKHLGVDVGSIIEFDIQGTTVAGEVRSIRKVDWSNFSTNFYMIFSPGALEGAPFTYVATARVSPGEELPLQEAVVAAFPNVTAINIADVMDNFARILERLSLAIRAIALFCILAGAVVMAAALTTTRYQRLYESVILKAFGATRGLIAQAFAVEYAVLGAIAGILGVLLASLLSWAILETVFDLRWTLQLPVLALGLMVTILLAVTVGFLSTFGILKERPLAILRGE